MTDRSASIRGFDRPGDYASTRPSYPDTAVDRLVEAAGVERGALVADVGAGTGKLTGMLTARGYRPLAMEPNDSMRDVLERDLPGVPAFAAVAESLPFGEDSLEMVTVAQALHLFDAAAAAREFHRVLVPGGACGLIWNRRVQDRLHDMIAELTEPLRDRMPSLRDSPWKAQWEETGLFGPFVHAQYRHQQWLSRAEVVQRTVSTPYVVAAPAHQRDEVRIEIERLVRTLPEQIRHDYFTNVYVTHARHRTA